MIKNSILSTSQQFVYINENAEIKNGNENISIELFIN